MVARVGEVKSTIKFQVREVPCLAVAIGGVKMTDIHLVEHLGFTHGEYHGQAPGPVLKNVLKTKPCMHI
jgi:ribosomal protein L1